jgi:hypothetical protein
MPATIARDYGALKAILQKRLSSSIPERLFIYKVVSLKVTITSKQNILFHTCHRHQKVFYFGPSWNTLIKFKLTYHDVFRKACF